MINNFLIEGNNFLFFDIFHKNNLLFLICPVNNDGINISEINIYNNDIKLLLKDKYSKLEYEAVEILIYDFISNEIFNKITVNFKNIIKEYLLENIKTKINNKLSLTTLFKDDYKLIDLFYNYYIKQGVTNFYMYYNGKLSEEIILKYNLPEIILIEWDFPYFKRNNYSSHYAQIGQIHHALFRYGKEYNEYMIFCDLDEYLYIPKIKLLDYFNSNSSIDMFAFNNLWSDIEDTKIPTVFPNKIKCSNIILEYRNRSKCVYKTNMINTINIHYNNYLKNIIVNDLIMLHFYKWNGTRNSIDMDVNNELIIELE